MLDVHPPHEKINGIRDFLLHLLTITIGLLIALGLEASVERWHQRERREQAAENLRQEVRDNSTKLAESQEIMKKESEALVTTLDFLAAKRTGKPYVIDGLNLGYSLRRLSDASWRTASATGALALMDYDTVQKYASAYQVQEQWMTLQAETLNDFLQVQAYTMHGFDPDKVTPAEAAAAEPDVRRALSHLTAMQQISAGMIKIYQDLPKSEQRERSHSILRGSR